MKSENDKLKKKQVFSVNKKKKYKKPILPWLMNLQVSSHFMKGVKTEDRKIYMLIYQNRNFTSLDFSDRFNENYFIFTPGKLSVVYENC